MIYANRIKYLRERNNTKEKDIANILKISKSLYCDYEQERKILPTKHLNIVSNYFNASFDYLLEFTNQKQYKSAKTFNHIDKKLVGNRLKELRKKFKLTQEDLGKDVGCSYGTIAGYEIGRYLISLPVLYKICKKYHISADYLLGKINSPKYLN